MATTHTFDVSVRWTGNRGQGTTGYRSYGRDHVVSADGNDPIAGSADRAFRGDPNRYNPEQLLVASIGQCHMLWYLHLCADEGVVVVSYEDAPRGELRIDAGGSGEFTRVELSPSVGVTSADMVAPSIEMHRAAHGKCFIARSVNFPIELNPSAHVQSSVHPDPS